MTTLYEQLGLFYIGKRVDTDESSEPVLELLKNKNLTTHAAIIGMTGSGKTGLGISLIEEAALDKIPAIVIDPKGDMGNLLLAFEDLSPQEFQKWVDPLEAQKRGITVEELAQETAALWKKGLESSYQSPERIKKMKSSADFRIYTPGSSAGVRLSILSSFEKPSQEIMEDMDSYTYILSSTAKTLLSLIDEDNENGFVLISSILDYFWKKGENLDIEKIISSIITPPFKKIGVLPLEGFYPKQKRMKLALKLNNLISSPSFSGWLEGEPLSIDRLLYGNGSKPQISIMYLAHLNEKERMFFVTLLLNRLISWMRRQSGTSALRALLYMDEIFGYFPPNSNPPSKEPMLLLLKQARAYGIGAVLSTQNPVDIDYKGLSNIGTWFLGRLQTRQDIERVIDGLQKGSEPTDKKELISLLTSLPKRTFILKSVHRENLDLFKTRWVLSYLKGPLSKDEIRVLTPKKETENIQKTKQQSIRHGNILSSKPIFSDSVKELYDIYDPSASVFRFKPFIYAEYSLVFNDTKRDIHIEKTGVCETEIFESADSIDWVECQEAEIKPFANTAPSNSNFMPVPAFMLEKGVFKKIGRDFARFIYRNRKLTLYRVKRLKIESKPNQSYEEFKTQVMERLRDLKESHREKIEKKFEKRVATLKKRLDRAYSKLQKEQSQAQTQTAQSVISIGLSLLEGLFGRGSVSSKIRRSATSAKRAYAQYEDIKEAKRNIEEIKNDIMKIESQLQKEIEDIDRLYDPADYPIEAFYIRPKLKDIDCKIKLLWKQL